MELDENIITLDCYWEFVAADLDGNIVWEERKKNLVVTTGKQLIMDRLFGLSSAVAVAGTAVGTGTAAPAATDTALTSAVYQAFDATPNRSGLVVTGTTTFGTGAANVTIGEAGLMTASGGVLLNRLLVGPFSKTSSVTLAITTTITQS